MADCPALSYWHCVLNDHEYYSIYSHDKIIVDHIINYSNLLFISTLRWLDDILNSYWNVVSANPARARCDKVCHWLAAGQWFSPGTSVSSTNKTDCQYIPLTEILLKVVLNITTLTLLTFIWPQDICGRFMVWVSHGCCCHSRNHFLFLDTWCFFKIIIIIFEWSFCN